MALAQEKEVILSVTRPHYMAWWLKVEREALPNGNLSGEPFVGLDADPWIKSGNAYYYLLPYSLTKPHTFTVRLPLNEVSDGASVTVKAVYAKNLWSEQNSGPPTSPENEGVLAEFKFKVGTFRIESIDFQSDISMYSGSAKMAIKDEEWKHGAREGVPTQQPWNAHTSSPAAFRVGDLPYLQVQYSCHGLTNVLLSAECDDTAYPSPVCEFGDITVQSVLCQGNATADFFSTDAPTSISASMNKFSWKLESSELTSAQTIARSTHRLYSLLGTPPVTIIDYYLEMADFLLIGAEGASDCLTAATNIRNYIYNQSWGNDRSLFRFIYPTADSIQWGSTFKYARNVGPDNSISNPNKPNFLDFDNESFINDLSTNPIIHGSCYDINGLMALGVNLSGCPLANVAITTTKINVIPLRPARLLNDHDTDCDSQHPFSPCIPNGFTHHFIGYHEDGKLVFDANIDIMVPGLPNAYYSVENVPVNEYFSHFYFNTSVSVLEWKGIREVMVKP